MTDRIAALAVFLAFGCSCSPEVETVAIPDSHAHQVVSAGCTPEDTVEELDGTAVRVCGSEQYGIRNIRYSVGCKHEVRAVIVCGDLPVERAP